MYSLPNVFTHISKQFSMNRSGYICAEELLPPKKLFITCWFFIDIKSKSILIKEFAIVTGQQSSHLHTVEAGIHGSITLYVYLTFVLGPLYPVKIWSSNIHQYPRFRFPWISLDIVQCFKTFIRFLKKFTVISKILQWYPI